MNVRCENSHRGLNRALIHVEKMGRNFDDYCKSCQQSEEEENIEHLLSHCPAYNSTRHDLLGNYILSNLSDIVATDIRAILKFVLRSKWA